MIKVFKSLQESRNKYRVYYNPYDYPDEEDFIEVYADNEKEAERKGSSVGYVTSIEEVDDFILSDE